MNIKFSRREFLRLMALATGAFLAGCQKIIPLMPTASQTAQPTQAPTPTAEATATTQPATETPGVKNLAAVYMTTAISADGLLKMYQTLGQAATGKVAVKISSGEPGGIISCPLT